MRMRMTSPLATERSTEPVVYPPRKPVFPPEFHRMDGLQKTSVFVATSHLAHLPLSSSTCQTWKSRNTDSTLVSSCISKSRGHAKLPLEIVLQKTSPKQHLKRDRFVCPEVHCGKHFPRSFALRRHMRIHTGTKPYACDYHGCLQRFNTSGNLSRHKRIHSGERPYPCDFEACNKRFNTSTKLKRHMRTHFPDGQNLFRCTKHACAWACDNYKEYVQHQKLHSSVHERSSDAPNEPIVTTNDISSDGVRSKQDKTTCCISAPINVVQSRLEPRHVECSVDMSLLAIHEDSDEHIRDRMYAGMAATDSSTMQRIMQERMSHQVEDSSNCQTGKASVLPHKSFLEDLASSQTVLRLPFPTRAIPSETAGAYSSSLLRSSLPSAPTLAHRYYFSAVSSTQVEMATSSNPNYTPVSTYDSTQGECSSYRHGSEANVNASSYQPTSTTATMFTFMSEQQYTQDIGQDIGQEILDRQYSSSAPHSGLQQPSLRSQPSFSSNPVPPEFTGEELSAVLELVKDS